MKRLLFPVFPAAAMFAGLWYLAVNPAVGKAVAAVVVCWMAAGSLLRRRRMLRYRGAQRTLGDLLSLTPREFEEAVAALLASSCYRKVRLCGGPADLGVDIVCLDRRGRTVAVQCKRHAPGISVGSGEIQRFLGSVVHARAEGGVIVTTSRFSGPATKLAEEHGIELIDGDALVGLAQQVNRRARRQRVP